MEIRRQIRLRNQLNGVVFFVVEAARTALLFQPELDWKNPVRRGGWASCLTLMEVGFCCSMPPERLRAESNSPAISGHSKLFTVRRRPEGTCLWTIR